MRLIATSIALFLASLTYSTAEKLPDDWQHLLHDADLRLAAGQFHEAEKVLERALKAGIPPDKRWTVLYTLGLAYSQTQDWAEAQGSLEQALKGAESVMGEDDPHLSRITHILAAVYQNDAQYQNAETLHKRTLALQEKVLPSGDPQLVALLMNVGSILNLELKGKEAEQYLRRALESASKSDRRDQVQLALIKDNLANSLRLQGRLDEAEGLYRESLPVLRDRYGDTHQFTADGYWGLAFIAKERGQFELAASLYEKAIRGFATFFPDTDPLMKQVQSEYDRVKDGLTHERTKHD